MKHYQQNENLTVDGIVGKADLDIAAVQMAPAVRARLTDSLAVVSQTVP